MLHFIAHISSFLVMIHSVVLDEDGDAPVIILKRSSGATANTCNAILQDVTSIQAK